MPGLAIAFLALLTLVEISLTKSFNIFFCVSIRTLSPLVPSSIESLVLWASKEHSTYASAQFFEIIQNKFSFKIECVQTDDGFEFSNRLSPIYKGKKTMSEIKAEELGIEHKVIRVRTPRHNGKAERSYRKDQERFYLQ